jgi:hypothetical protein
MIEIHFRQFGKWIKSMIEIHFRQFGKWIKSMIEIHFCQFEKWIKSTIDICFSAVWKWSRPMVGSTRLAKCFDDQPKSSMVDGQVDRTSDMISYAKKSCRSSMKERGELCVMPHQPLDVMPQHPGFHVSTHVSCHISLIATPSKKWSMIDSIESLKHFIRPEK